MTDSHTLAGPILEPVNRIEVLPGIVNLLSKWTLVGMKSNDRYVTRSETMDLAIPQRFDFITWFEFALLSKQP